MRPLPLVAIALACSLLGVSAGDGTTHARAAFDASMSLDGVAGALELERAADDEILFSTTSLAGDARIAWGSGTALTLPALGAAVSASAGAPGAQLVVADVELSSLARRLTGRSR